MNKIVINGKSYSGSNIVIRNGNIIIDGADATPNDKVINIEVVGNINSLQVDVCDKVSITGEVGNVSSQSGDIICGDVNGNVANMSGDVTCGNVQGKVKTMSGDISHQ